MDIDEKAFKNKFDLKNYNIHRWSKENSSGKKLNVNPEAK
jgi:hypothetical protein